MICLQGNDLHECHKISLRTHAVKTFVGHPPTPCTSPSECDLLFLRSVVGFWCLPPLQWRSGFRGSRLPLPCAVLCRIEGDIMHMDFTPFTTLSRCPSFLAFPCLAFPHAITSPAEEQDSWDGREMRFDAEGPSCHDQFLFGEWGVLTGSWVYRCVSISDSIGGDDAFGDFCFSPGDLWPSIGKIN